MKGAPAVVDLIDRVRAGLAPRYEVKHEVGRGGMAVVFLAQDLQLKRPVAIKVLRPEFTASIIADRFLQEIRIAAQLDHPLIVALYESDSSDGLLWYAMPYVQGETLQQRLVRENQLPMEEAVRITREVAEALDYAHRQGVIHRDIKPANILLADGHLRVADFGIAKAFTEAGGPTSTATGVGMGTPGYMSPEQATGEKNIDVRTDVYSLACVLYEMLAGETPYTGPTAQAIIAKQLSLPVPSVCTVRETVPPALDEVLRRALAKVPADRFPTAAEFAEALGTAAESRAFPRVRAGKRVARFAALSTIATAGAVGALIAFGGNDPSLDSNKVVVFPLVERGLRPADSGAGYDVALMIGAALEHTEPLKWIDGWSYLDERRRANVGLLPLSAARAIARDRGARYFADGVVRSRGDSSAVVVRLHDADGDSVIAQETVTAAAGQPLYQLGLTALRRLLPRLLDPGREIDLGPLSDRRPAAIALWIQGQREYRQSRFAPALDFFQRAVGEDSALAFAAMKGAEAANWLTNLPEARRLLSIALGHEALLPQRYRYVARGLEAYLWGRADSAIGWLDRALAEDPQWAEASMVRGDVFYHLFPSRTPLDSLAEAAFEKARTADSSFTPPLLHLVEIAVGHGETARARALFDRLRRVEADSTLLRQLSLMVECLEGGSRKVDWDAAARGNLLALLYAAKGFSAAVSQPACGEAGFRAVLANHDASLGYRWAALLGLQGLLAAQRRTTELTALLDSAAAANTQQRLWSYVMGLYVTDVEAGLPVQARGSDWEAFERRKPGDSYQGIEPPLQWLLGVWHARLGNVEKVAALHDALAARVATPPERRNRLLAQALAGHLALALGDTAGAIKRFRALSPNATTVGDTLQWHFWESLAVERLKLARLLLARGEYEEAHRVAAAFDHPGPIAYVAFVPASLSVRLEAAEALGRSELAAAYRARLLKLGQAGTADSR